MMNRSFEEHRVEQEKIRDADYNKVSIIVATWLRLRSPLLLYNHFPEILKRSVNNSDPQWLQRVYVSQVYLIIIRAQLAENGQLRKTLT